MIPPSALIVVDNRGAVGNGTHDDTDALQRAIEAAEAFDGQSTVWLSTGSTYRVTQPLTISGSGVTFAGGGTIVSGGANTFIAHGDFSATIHDIEPASYGATSVTTVGGHDLVAGDWVFIQAGQTSAFNAPPLGAPDAEINRVSAVNGQVLSLLWPLTKDYAQEYFDVGEGVGSGTTTADGEGDPALLAVRRVEPAVDIRFQDITIVHEGSGSSIAGDLYVDLLIDGVTATTATNFLSVSPWTGTVRNTTITVDDGWWVAAAFGARDVTIEDCTFVANTLGYLHLHEGVSDATIRRCTFTNAAGIADGDRAVIGVRGRGYRITLHDIDVVNSSTSAGGAGVRVDVGITGSATDYVFTGTGSRIANNAPSTFVDNG